MILGMIILKVLDPLYVLIEIRGLRRHQTVPSLRSRSSFLRTFDALEFLGDQLTFVHAINVF